jgi:hypothetical protein
MAYRNLVLISVFTILLALVGVSIGAVCKTALTVENHPVNVSAAARQAGADVPDPVLSRYASFAARGGSPGL